MKGIMITTLNGLDKSGEDIPLKEVRMQDDIEVLKEVSKNFF